MPSSTTETSICNSALIKIGAARISSLSDDSKSARICSEQYSKLRDEVLSAHPWNFSTARVSLGLLGSTPAFGFDYQFQLPTDCLRVFEIDDDRSDWKVEGRYLLCNNSAVKIRYAKQEEDASLYSAAFVEALACRMASEFAYSIAQSVTLQSQMFAAYKDLLKQARSVDGQEGSGDELQANSWIDARG